MEVVDDGEGGEGDGAAVHDLPGMRCCLSALKYHEVAQEKQCQIV
jgi:hypothetical protein